MVNGYGRVSTPHQKIERQIANIQREFPNAKLYLEKYTGTTMERPRWRELMNQVQSGDTIVFDSVSRMSRNADEGVEEYMALFKKGVNLIFLKEPQINTDVYREAVEKQAEMTGDTLTDAIMKFLNELCVIIAEEQIRKAFEQAEKEVDDLHKRTSEGMDAAKKKNPNLKFGHKSGTPFIPKKKKPAKELIEKFSDDFFGSLNDVAVMKVLKSENLVKSKTTYYKYKAELRAEWERNAREGK